MKVKDIIQLLEDLLFEIISWIVFFPITLIRVMKLTWAYTYVSEAYAEDDPKKRYLYSISPILFYFIAVILSTVVIEKQFDLTFEILESVTQTNLMLSALQVFSIPFITSLPLWVLISWQRGVAFNFEKDSLRRLFEVQCLVWPTIYLLGSLISLYALFFGAGEGDPSLSEILMAIFIGLAGLYFLVIVAASFVPDIQQTSLSAIWKAVFGMANLGWYIIIIRYILPGNFVFSGIYQLLTNP
jgi:uncharacterized membrane protein